MHALVLLALVFFASGLTGCGGPPPSASRVLDDAAKASDDLCSAAGSVTRAELHAVAQITCPTDECRDQADDVFEGAEMYCRKVNAEKIERTIDVDGGVSLNLCRDASGEPCRVAVAAR